MNFSSVIKTSLILILIGAFIFLLFKFVDHSKKETFTPKKQRETGIIIKKLSDEVEHGLYEIKIDDSTTIFLYRGVESCTMIKK